MESILHNKAWERGFLISSAVMLVITAFAKLASVTIFSVPIHDAPDALFGLRLRSLLGGVAVAELLVAAYILIGQSRGLNLGLVAFLSSQFLSYRILAGEMRYCQCLGTAFQNVPVIGGNEGVITLSLAVLMFAGSIVFIVARIRVPLKSTFIIQE